MSRIQKRICLGCGEEFEVNHRNRRYCPPPGKCKQDANNHKAKQIRQLPIERHLDAIRTNWNILSELYNQFENQVIGLDFFRAKGFNFSYLSQVKRDPNSNNQLMFTGEYHLKKESNGYRIIKYV
jgi:hypothetical protein